MPYPDSDSPEGSSSATPSDEGGATTTTTADTRTVDVETLRRALAELEDAKWRLRRDSERELERQRGRVLEALLPVLDNLERSIDAASSSRQIDALITGMKMVHGQFLGALVPFGLERVSVVGTRFDPSLHDAVSIVPVADPRQDGVVIAELEPAYRVGGKLVRPAKVQVGRGASFAQG